MVRSDARSLIEAVISEPAPSRTIAEHVTDRLRELIVSGQLPAGTPLLLTPLAAQLQVSVMPVREALRALEAEGLAVVTPRRGAVVSEPSFEEAEEIYTIRIALEALCARHAVESLTNEDLGDLHAAFARMENAASAGDLRAFMDLDHEFHSRLYQAAGRDRLAEMIDALVGRSLRYIPYLNRELREDPLESHRPILRAIEARDADLVERLTREHMQGSKDRLLSAIRHDSNERTLVTAHRT